MCLKEERDVLVNSNSDYQNEYYLVQFNEQVFVFIF